MLQQLGCDNPLVIHQVENTKAATEISFSSSPCNGKIARPPTAAKATASGVVHAGHPGVNAANALPATVEPPDFLMLIPAEPLILYTINEMLTPASPATITDNASEAPRYNGIALATTAK